MTDSASSPSRAYRGVAAADRAAARRDQLIDAGLKVYGSRGYAQATVKEVCQQAGLTERYFYESFSNKEELLVAVYERITGELKAEVAAILQDTQRAPEQTAMLALRAYYAQLQIPERGRVQQFEVLGVSPAVDRVYRAAMHDLADMSGHLLTLVFADWASRSDRALVETGIAGALIQIGNSWVLDGYPQSLDKLVLRIAQMLRALGEGLKQLQG